MLESSKLQIPSSKEAPSPKHQAPNAAPCGMVVWDLVLGVSLGFGAWDLELFHSAPPLVLSGSLLQRFATVVPALPATASCGVTGMPGRTRWRPLTTIF